MNVITETGRVQSEKLAEKRGSFPLFSESIFKDNKPLRNGTITTIAPTGTLSIIAACSSGVEPIFGYVFIRNVMDGTQLVESNSVLKEILNKRGLYSEDLMKKIASEGTLAHIDEIPDDIKRVFVSAHDISPEYHIKMQAAFQRHTDNAVSKTVNFPNEATREDVYNVYMNAYELGCKGVTIYRDGSRTGQVLNIGKVNDDKKDTHESSCEASLCEACEYKNNLAKIEPRDRPEVCNGFTERVKIGCGNLYITVNYDENGICEVFTNTGKAGGCRLRES
jgi:ribonucleoside-diphosphate reductase alpha chain